MEKNRRTFSLSSKIRRSYKKCIPRVIRDGRVGKERTDIYLVGSDCFSKLYKVGWAPSSLGEKKMFLESTLLQFWVTRHSDWYKLAADWLRCWFYVTSNCVRWFPRWKSLAILAFSENSWVVGYWIVFDKRTLQASKFAKSVRQLLPSSYTFFLIISVMKVNLSENIQRVTPIFTLTTKSGMFV